MPERFRKVNARAEERLRNALLNVDQATSLWLQFYLMLLRIPQLIAGLRATVVATEARRLTSIYSIEEANWHKH